MKKTPPGMFPARLLPLLLAALSLSGMTAPPDVTKVDPLLRLMDAPALVGVQREVFGAAIRENVPVPVFLRLSEDDEDLARRVDALGGTALRVGPRLHIAHLPPDALRYVSHWPQVSYVEAPRVAKPLLDLSRPAVSANAVQAPGTLPPPFDGGITGAGTFVGIVDSGLAGDHPDFGGAAPDSPSRIARAAPSSANPLVDEDGHGTHVAGIAVGNGAASAGLYTGMAPGAAILAWKTTFNTADVVQGTQDLVAFAEAQGGPVAVNLSLGASLGPHDGTSAFETGVDALAAGSPGSRRIVTAAAGNGGDLGGHFRQSSLPPFGSTTASLVFEHPVPGAEVQIWADGEDRYAATVTLTGGNGATVDSVSVPSGSTASSPGGRITVFNRTSTPPNGATFIAIFFDSLPGERNAIRLDRTRNGGTGRIDAYVDEANGEFEDATPFGTITEPANAANVLAVGSFNTKTFNGQPAGGAITSFSSRGPTRDGRLKPDLTAPGLVLFSARSFAAPEDNFIDIVPEDNNYAVLAGTSMSAPHIAGIAALVWESSPDLTGAQMRERLRRTADPVPPSPNLTWGYGKANALSAVAASVAAITAPATARPGETVTLASGDSSAPFGGTITGHTWSPPTDPGVSLTPSGPSATFSAGAPGDYTVGLEIQTDPPGTSSVGDSAVIHVNTVPEAAVSTPGSDNTGVPVTFVGSGSDPDNQPLAFRWVLVERPAGSAVSGLAADGSQAVLIPDTEGTYTVGLRVDDGLDNSALVLGQYKTAGTSPPPALSAGGGSGGGCSAAPSPADRGRSPAASALLLLLPLAWPLLRKAMFSPPG